MTSLENAIFSINLDDNISSNIFYQQSGGSNKLLAEDKQTDDNWTLIIMRHGLAYHNKLQGGKVIKKYNSQLRSQGVEGAKESYQKLKEYIKNNFKEQAEDVFKKAHFISSPLDRTIETLIHEHSKDSYKNLKLFQRNSRRNLPIRRNRRSRRRRRRRNKSRRTRKRRKSTNNQYITLAKRNKFEKS